MISRSGKAYLDIDAVNTTNSYNLATFLINSIAPGLINTYIL